MSNTVKLIGISERVFHPGYRDRRIGIEEDSYWETVYHYHCSECGSPVINDKAKFCSGCGKPISKVIYK